MAAVAVRMQQYYGINLPSILSLLKLTLITYSQSSTMSD